MKIDLFCCMCGKPFRYDFQDNRFEGRSCSQECYDKFQHKRALSIMGLKLAPGTKPTEPAMAAVRTSK